MARTGISSCSLKETAIRPLTDIEIIGDSVADIILVLFVVLSAYFVRGITGFGSGLIAVPLLALSHPLTFAVPLVLALDFTASFVLGGANRKNADWERNQAAAAVRPDRRVHRRLRAAEAALRPRSC